MQLSQLGVDDVSHFLPGPFSSSLLRSFFSMLRIAHAFFGLAMNGLLDPTLCQSMVLVVFKVSQILRFPRKVDATNRPLPLIHSAFWKLFGRQPSIEVPQFELLSAGIFIMFSAVVSSTHYNMGENRIDAPLAGFQAGDAWNAFVKTFVFERFIMCDLFRELNPNDQQGIVAVNITHAKTKLTQRSMIHLILFLSLAWQWFVMPQMFTKAVRPYAHIVAEIGSFGNAILRWKWASELSSLWLT